MQVHIPPEYVREQKHVKRTKHNNLSRAAAMIESLMEIRTFKDFEGSL